MKRSGRVNPKNVERAAAAHARCFGAQAELARRSCCAVLDCPNGPPCEPAHHPSRGAGGRDEDVLPLCTAHHQEQHQHGVRTFERRHKIDLEAEVIRMRELVARQAPREQAVQRAVARSVDAGELATAVLWLRSVNATVSFDARGGVTVRANGLARRRATLLEAVAAARAGHTVAGIRRSVERIKRGPLDEAAPGEVLGAARGWRARKGGRDLARPYAADGLRQASNRAATV